jgi:GAF domain-containing protein
MWLACHESIISPVRLVLPDALADERFRDNPTVAFVPRVRFYASAQVRTAASHLVGTLRILDVRPRDLTEAELDC